MPAAARQPRRSPAERQREHRARRACGLVAFQIVLDEVAVAEMLIAGGLLAPNDTDDHRKVTAALEAQIGILCELARHA
jgi:hypothetical protein